MSSGRGDPLRQVHRGDRVLWSRKGHNAVMDATRDYRQQQIHSGGAGGPAPVPPFQVITLKNTESSTTWGRFSVIKLGNPIVDPTDFLHTFQNDVNFEGAVPTAVDNDICILQEDLIAQAMGKAVVSGITPCQINMLDPSHEFAHPTVGDVTKLTSHPRLGVRIYWNPPGLTGTQWCYVVLGAGGITSFLVQLVDKTYSGTTAVYSWLRVEEDTGVPPLTYIELPEEGGPGNWPVISEQKIDLVVCPVFTVGPNSPDATANDSATGDVAWTNPGNAIASDGSYATAVLTPGQSTQWLMATDFDFDQPPPGLPPGAIPRKVTAEVQAKSSVADTIVDFEVKLVKGSAITGNSKATETLLTTSDAYQSFAHILSVWGVTLADTDVESTGFGFAIRYKNTGVSSATVSVDHMRVTVSYGFGLKPGCVVRVRKGVGNWYLCDHEPRWEYVEQLPAASDVTIGGVTYHRGWLLRYNQVTKEYVRLEEILIHDITV